jgi:hypothetical protein
MDSAAKQAQRTIAVLSTSYVSAAYTHPEWASALARDPTGQKRVLLPIRVHECTLTGLLAQVVYIDLVGLNEIEAKSRLLSQVQGERGKPLTAPQFPGRSTGPAIEAPPYPAVEASASAVETHAPSSRTASIIGGETEVFREAEQDLISYSVRWRRSLFGEPSPRPGRRRSVRGTRRSHPYTKRAAEVSPPCGRSTRDRLIPVAGARRRISAACGHIQRLGAGAAPPRFDRPPWPDREARSRLRIGQGNITRRPLPAIG